MKNLDMNVQTQPHSPGLIRRIWTVMTGHPRISATIAVAAVALAIFGFLWFRPDKLFVNTTVNEALPPVADAPSVVRDASGASEPEVLSTGSFRSLEHETDGLARLLRLGDDRAIVRLENFRTSNGPDVVVILSDAAATSSDAGAYDDGNFVLIGGLKGTRGAQNYEIPGGVDPSKYHSVVIWCRRFNVAFGAAPLEVTR